MLDPFIFVLVFGSIFLGIHGERWRVRGFRNARRSRWAARRSDGSSVLPFVYPAPAKPLTDAAEQLRIVTEAAFDKQSILTRTEAKVLFAAEKAIKDAKLPWRVMAQVSLGEVLTTSDARAYSAINSKRVDLLVISPSGEPLAAIEYQGYGHYQGNAAARDAVKKEALRKAGVRYIEVTPEHSPEDIAREFSRMMKVEQLKQLG